MATEELYSLINRYLTDQMSEEERLSFEARVKDEPELAEELKLHVRAEYAARDYAYDQRREVFNREFERLAGGEGGISIRPFNPVYWGSIAAVIVVLIGLAFIFWPKKGSLLDMEALYAGEITNQVMSVRRSAGDTSQVSQTWQEASTLFNRGEYALAIQSIEEVLRDSSFNNTAKAQLYLGLSHLKLQEHPPTQLSEVSVSHYEEAIKAFGRVAEESTFIENALWFTALTYAKSGQEAELIPALEKVIAYPNHYKKASAEALLQRLRENQ